MRVTDHPESAVRSRRLTRAKRTLEKMKSAPHTHTYIHICLRVGLLMRTASDTDGAIARLWVLAFGPLSLHLFLSTIAIGHTYPPAQ